MEKHIKTETFQPINHTLNSLRVKQVLEFANQFTVYIFKDLKIK